MKWIVRMMNDLTAYDTFRGDDPGREDDPGGPLHEEINSYEFDSEEEALATYNRIKTSLRIAGSKGMYVTYPVKKENQ